MMRIYRNKTVGGALLVTGTSIGAGMLALPITTGASGFCLSILLFIICFGSMLLSLFYLMEATLTLGNQQPNLITMCKNSLGLVGEGIAWSTFLMLLYSVAAAYLSGGGSLVSDALTLALGWNISQRVGTAIFLVVFGLIIVFETKVIDVINRFCMGGLLLAFLSLFFFVFPHVKVDHLKGGDGKYLWASVPVVILSFTSHIIVPSLNAYFKRNTRQLKKVLFLGSLISLMFYLIWEYLIIGSLPPTGALSLESIAKSSYPVAALTETLHSLSKTPWIGLSVGLFSFFALVTSFFGVALSLYDFLADGFKIQATLGGKTLLLILMFTPPLLFVIFFPSGFIVALGYAGIFVAILYGLLPAWMVWRQRYVQKKRGPFQVFGGKFVLCLMIGGSLGVIWLQIAAAQKWLPTL